MKIVHWEEMFHPLFGYQINLLTKFQAMQGHEVIIVSSDKVHKHPIFKNFALECDIFKEDRIFEKANNVKVYRLPIYGFYSGRVLYKPGYLKFLDSLSPDLLFCHTNDTLSGISITINASKMNYPVVFDNHMLDMASRNKFSKIFQFFYRKLITPIIIKNKYIVIRTQNDNYVNKKLGIPVDQTPYISFGTDCDLFKPNEIMKNNFRKKFNITNDSLVIIYTGKLNDSKGAMFFSNSIIEPFMAKKDLVFIIVGNSSGNYGKKLEQNFKKSKNRILRFETQSYKDLATFYQSSDVCVFPKQSSLSFFDAQACGLPVISENNNINIDRLKHNNGTTFEANNIFSFREKIQFFLDLSQEELNNYKNASFNYVNKSFNYIDIARDYTKILEKTYEKFNKN
jgi:glycosyltransferase involved in cell wall biosynthesis